MLKRKIVKGSVPVSAPLPQAQANAKVTKQQPELDETEDSEDRSKGRSSLAAAFDSVSLSSSASEIPPGKYEAIVSRLTLQEPDQKGQSVRANFELCSPAFDNKNQLVTWFKLLESDHRTPIDGGIKAFKAMLAKLGYELKGADMEDPDSEIYATITQEQPGVTLKISYQQANDGNTYQRILVDSLCDNEVIAQYKDNVPY
jgi:hypothetical protein